MLLTHWLRNLGSTVALGRAMSFLSSEQSRAARRAPDRNYKRRRRLTVETLEMRALLTAGDLDASFGSGGLVINDLSPANDAAIDVIALPSGKSLVGGYTTNSQGRDAVVRRYNADGSLDTTFGTNGTTTIDFKGGWNEGGMALAVQPDGKIIGVAASYNPQDFTFPYDARWGVARFTANGLLDKTFGASGKVITDLSKGTDSPSGVAIQADGKIVVSGATNGFAGGDNAVVARYNANGSVDTTFGAGRGYVITDFGGSDRASDMAIQSSDGKIIIVGHAEAGTIGYPSQFALARYNTNGSLDATFGNGGKVLTPFSDVNGPYGATAKDVVVQDDGRIVVTGSTFVVRYLSSNGSLDPSFGTGGIVRTIDSQSIVAQADGKLVLGGSEDFFEDLGNGNSGTSSRFLLTRISGIDGSLDTSFGSGGFVRTYVTQPGQRAFNFLNALAIQSDGRILVAAGTGLYGATGSVNQSFTVARYLGDPALPPSPLLAAPLPQAESKQRLSSRQVQLRIPEALARRQAADVNTFRLGNVQFHPMLD